MIFRGDISKFVIRLKKIPEAFLNMGYMDRIRSLAPWFILGVGGIFILFMVVSDMNLSQVMNDRSNIGEINGEKVKVQEFEQFYQNYLTRLKQSGQQPDLTNDQQIREQAWEQFVQLKILENAYKKYNITVAEDEIRNIVLGENPPEYLKSSFMDSNGVFNRAAYEQALKDPRNKENLIMVESQIKEQLMFQKLQALVSAGVVVTDAEIRRKFRDQDVKISADYALIDLNVYPDSTVKPTDEELKDFYNKNSYLYKQDANRKLKFVAIPVKPSEKDSQAVFTILKNILTRIKTDTVSTFQSFVEAQSESPYSKDTVAVNMLPAGLRAYKGEIKAGDVLGPVSGEGEMGLYKISSVVDGKDVFARASHILLPKSSDDKADLEAATKLYEELKKGKNFEQTAKEVSKDPGSAANGGDLGWFGKGAMVKPFEDACFNGPVGEIQPPVKTDYGYHIIRVSERSSKKYVIEKITKKLSYSPATLSLVRRDAEDLLALASKLGLDSAAKSKNLVAQETTPFPSDVAAVPGLGYSRNLVALAFKDGLNDFLPVTLVGGQMVVAQVSEVNTAGVKKFESVKQEVTTATIREKKFAIALAELNAVKGKIGNDLSKAPSISKNIRFGTADSFTVAGNIPGLGVDYGFSFASSKAPLNTVTGPVKGLRGYYLINVKMRQNFNEQNFLAQRNALRDQILGERRQMAFQQWMEIMKKEANIKFYPQN